MRQTITAVIGITVYAMLTAGAIAICIGFFIAVAGAAVNSTPTMAAGLKTIAAGAAPTAVAIAVLVFWRPR